MGQAMTPLHRCIAFAAALASLASGACRAEHDLEYVAEHLPEVAMDNRYATLPLWGSSFADSPAWSAAVQGAFSRTTVGPLAIDGPLFAAALRRSLSRGWSVSAFGFYDGLALTGSRDERPLQTFFAPATPLQRPVDVQFTGLDGNAKNYGVGVSVTWRSSDGFLGEHRWLGGVLWQRVQLRDYRFDYRIVAGPQTGTTGEIDFDADYAHVAPFAGLEIPRDFGHWTLTAHALFAPIHCRGAAW